MISVNSALRRIEDMKKFLLATVIALMATQAHVVAPASARDFQPPAFLRVTYACWIWQKTVAFLTSCIKSASNLVTKWNFVMSEPTSLMCKSGTGKIRSVVLLVFIPSILILENLSALDGSMKPLMAQ